ncbi:SDR family NAD(P)-dependent oxidoreductase [Halosquirtibacter xylanolyticus]|uniref:SDR family NAD(P)-dependent oxidoreductase n=1 Tax=Halosquirtibacter xylanolyticus TaxID=3374599 RepID=UPI003747FB2C|nr:SDR family NAD(P)-dependent oxidoreductase [Prolixibacteraceae bacterium]
MIQTRDIPSNKALRMLSWTFLQKVKTPRCPSTPRLDNQIAVITGGSRGIGLETTRGLLARGAEVVVFSRKSFNADTIVSSHLSRLHHIKLDLSDIETIQYALVHLKEVLQDRKIDILINNAGVALRKPYTLSKQGYEMTFAINVLGPHILFRELHENALLSTHAHIINIAGDIYSIAKGCTTNFKYEGKNGMIAYARSKVGVMWWSNECKKVYPQYTINTIHPGVVPMGLGSEIEGWRGRLLNQIFLSPKQGAQMTLICCTQPEIEDGAYYHNTLGKAKVPKGDISLDRIAAIELWQRMEEIFYEMND